jgi:hypothetical protein
MNAKVIMKYFSLMIAVFAISVSVSGCSLLPKGGNSQSKRVLDSSTYASALPSDFEGLYADQFANIIKIDSSDFVYSIIKNSKITDQGFNLAQGTFKKCINNGGYGVHFDNSPFLQGAYIVEAANDDGSIDGPVDDMIENCDKESGYTNIAELYYTMLANPQRADLSDEIAKCLVKFKYRKEGYTGQDYLNEHGGSRILVNVSGYGNKDTKPGSNFVLENVKTHKDTPGLNYLKCQNDPKAVLSEK